MINLIFLFGVYLASPLIDIRVVAREYLLPDFLLFLGVRLFLVILVLSDLSLIVAFLNSSEVRAGNHVIDFVGSVFAGFESMCK